MMSRSVSTVLRSSASTSPPAPTSSDPNGMSPAARASAASSMALRRLRSSASVMGLSAVRVLDPLICTGSCSDAAASSRAHPLLDPEGIGVALRGPTTATISTRGARVIGADQRPAGAVTARAWQPSVATLVAVALTAVRRSSEVPAQPQNTSICGSFRSGSKMRRQRAGVDGEPLTSCSARTRSSGRSQRSTQRTTRRRSSSATSSLRGTRS